jgi:methionine synthase reductase
MCNPHIQFTLADLRTVVFVISSTGDGDPPDNALTCVRALTHSNLSADGLSHVHYTLLGLGDSNYSTFHGCPKDVLKRLHDLRATQFYRVGLADDAVGYGAG